MNKFTIPWYKNGLRFACNQCGKCCTGSPGFVWVSEEEISHMANLLNLPIPDFKRLYVKRMGQKYLLVERKKQNHSCVFYQDQKCQVYESRPVQCRTYPFWQENVNSEQSWEQAALDCEGIHPEAPLVSFDEIETCRKRST